MTLSGFIREVGAGTGLALVGLTGMLLRSPRGQAQNSDDGLSRIQQGLAIAPVRLKLNGKSPAQVALVGPDSYLVNGANDCNFCNTSGGPPNFNFLSMDNPYFLNQRPEQTDPSQYLAAGAPFDTTLPSNVPRGTAYGTYLGPIIVSRNLTTDKNGLAEGGHTLAECIDILRNGVDFDHIRPTCTSPTAGPGGTPYPPKFTSQTPEFTPPIGYVTVTQARSRHAS
jgi:hypothetical protein